MQESTRAKLQSPKDTPLVPGSDRESLNLANLQNSSKPADDSKHCSHCVSGYYLRKQSRMSAHQVFVLDDKRKPLTPTTNARAKKLLKGKQAKPIWNRFGQFGIQMIASTRTEKPKTVLGIDFGTKFEGYAIVTGKENNLAVMLKLPDKKKLVKKLENRRELRRARRFRNCRRRECRSNNRERNGFIAPSQLLMVNSRLKMINEFFSCYPIDVVALEDVCFNHSDKHCGRNFSTIEIGKKRINDWIRQRSSLQFFKGYETEECRARYDYKKSKDKSAEVFNTHCSDALAIATDMSIRKHIQQGKFIVVDDTYRCVRRKLHDTQPSKGGVRDKYSTGNFKGIRKGTVCNFGQICGGIKENTIRTYDWNSKRISKSVNKVLWLSHKYKTKEDVLIPHCNKIAVSP